MGVRTRERGESWAEVSWLREDSEGWKGIQKEVFLEDWREIEQVRVGQPLTEEGRKVGAAEEVEAVAGGEPSVEGAVEDAAPVKVDFAQVEETGAAVGEQGGGRAPEVAAA